MQVETKNILLTVAQSKRVADLVVSISIPVSGIADCCLKRLKTKCEEGSDLMPGSEMASLAFSLYETIRDKLAGSALEVFKTKVSNIDCNSIDGHFVITFNTQPTGTSLRKTCGLALSCLNVSKLFTKYSQNMKFLSGKSGNREEFNTVAKKFMEGAKKGIIITAIGKINTDVNKLKDIIAVLITKMPEFTLPSAKEIVSLPAHKKGMESSYPTVKCSGLARAITADYVRNNSNGMSIGVVDEGIVIYSHIWETKHKHLKDNKRIEDYINKKYLKLEDKQELSPLFAYFSLSEGFINSDIAEKIIGSKLKTSKLIELLKKTL
jgi:hypothetical protein